MKRVREDFNPSQPGHSSLNRKSASGRLSTIKIRPAAAGISPMNGLSQEYKVPKPPRETITTKRLKKPVTTRNTPSTAKYRPRALIRTLANCFWFIGFVDRLQRL